MVTSRAVCGQSDTRLGATTCSAGWRKYARARLVRPVAGLAPRLCRATVTPAAARGGIQPLVRRAAALTRAGGGGVRSGSNRSPAHLTRCPPRAHTRQGVAACASPGSTGPLPARRLLGKELGFGGGEFLVG